MLRKIIIGGKERELLVTPSLYRVAKKKGWSLNIEDIDDHLEMCSMYCVIIACAIHNARKIRQYDEDLPDEDITLMDIELWRQEDPKRFMSLIVEIAEALSGLTKDQNHEKKKD